MSTAPPTVPPRPARAAQAAAAQGVSKLPDIPPRPASKRVERSISPGHYPRSPLNEPYLVKTRSRDPIPRPPSVHHLPTPGEEGMEYANVNYEPQQSSALALDAAAQTRTIGEDLHLHAPKPSLPVSSATAQVQNVTRTDSAQAAEHGVGRNSTDDLSRTKSRTGYSRPPSAASATDRRRSAVYAEDDAHASIGIRVPINPLLGDVQAPTPSGLSPQVTGEAQRKHGRRRSLMDHQLPADTYGLHGHGVPTSDKFEREWYAKHPDQLEHEEGHGHGVYEGIGSGRGSFALSSEQLNRLVRDTASRGSGFATSEKINSYPDEQIGYMASEEYQRSQQNTPLPESQTTNPLSRVQTHEPPVVSPLRRTSFPAEDAQSPEVRRSKQSLPSSEVGDAAVHIDSPKRRYNKVTGGQESMNETEEAKPYAAHGLDYGHEYRVPILAEDEVAKEIGGEHMNPAVSPVMARRGSGQYDDHNDSGAATPHSRPASRPNSVYQMHSASHSLSRFLSHQDERDHMHTPLDDVAEYEPLFDDDGKPETQADRFRKRPDAQKRFPSQDIWEDTPSSAMYVTEVSTPDLPAQLQGQNDRVPASSVFEPPEAEHARKGEVSEAEKKKLIPAEERLKMSAIAPHMKNEVSGRPGLSNRFPSQDIWEDTPDSNYLTTTVGDEQDYRDEEDETSPVDTKRPEIPTRPAKSRLGEGASSAQIAPSVAPSIPARPPKRQHMVPPAGAQLTEPITLSRETSPTELKKAPSIPDRPKPQVPPRPARKPADDELHKTLSAGSDEASTTRAKPQVPARPMGGNIAALKGNFMSDLNKKLGLGPPKEKEPEPEPAQPKQLEDARKGRARGPQRRAPAKSPSGAAQSTPPTLKFSMFVPKSLWSIDEDGSLSMTKKSEALAANKTEVVDHAPGAAGSAPIQSEAAPEPITATSAAETVEPRIAASKAVAPEALVEQTPGAFPDEDEDPERDLTRKTTATSYTGSDIEREDSPPATHVLPASRMTTASDESAPEAASKADDNTLIREPTRESTNERIAEDEPPKLRSEQVNAPAPGPDALAEKHSSVSGSAPVNPEITASGQGEGLSVEGKATEPMNEEDVKYSKLEEMTAVADGKAHAEEEPEAVNTGRS